MRTGLKFTNSGIKRGDKHNDRNTHIVFDIPENTTTFTIEISTALTVARVTTLLSAMPDSYIVGHPHQHLLHVERILTVMVL